jgi:hypothetical protein
MKQVADLSNKLSSASVKTAWVPQPFLDEWPKSLDKQADWHFTPEICSLYGTPAWEKLTEAQRKEAAFYEAVNFFSLNIHGERELIQGLAKRLYKKWPDSISQYIHHFLGEENNHMTLFGNFCMRYHGRVYPDKKFAVEKELVPGEDDFLFFAKVCVFEEIVDFYNVTMQKDERLHPTTRQINAYHHLDESRHLAFGRAIMQTLFEEYKESWGPEKTNQIRADLLAYVAATQREYYNPRAYKDLGLENALDLVDLAWKHPAQVELRERSTKKLMEFLSRSGVA